MSDRTPRADGLTLAPNSPGDANNPAASLIELQVHRFWGRFELATQLPNDSANAAGAPAHTLMRPGDVAWVQEDAQLYVLRDRGTASGADAVWEPLAKGSTGVPDVDYTTSPTAADHYDGGAAVCPGADNFIVSFWYRFRGPAAPVAFKDICRNDTFNSGWNIFWNFGTVRFECFDGSGVSIGGNPSLWYATNRYETGRDVLLTLRVFQSGGVMNAQLWFNDTIAETQVAANPGMTQSTGTLKLLGGGESEAAEGFVYYAGTMTDAALSDWINKALDAGSVVAMPAETNRWTHVGTVLGATWPPATGGASLTRNGAPGTARHKVNRG